MVSSFAVFLFLHQLHEGTIDNIRIQGQKSLEVCIEKKVYAYWAQGCLSYFVLFTTQLFQNEVPSKKDKQEDSPPFTLY